MNNKDDLLKSISTLLDETIKEYEELTKSDISLQPDENGDMAGVAGQAGDDAMKPLKKEEGKEATPAPAIPEEKKDEKPAEVPAEGKEDDGKCPECGKDMADCECSEGEAEEKEESKPPFEKTEEDADEEILEKYLMDLIGKVMMKTGLIKSEPEKVEVIEEPKGESLTKSLEERMDKFEASIAKITEVLEKRPAVPARRSLDGLGAVRKSEEEAGNVGKPSVSPAEALDKLLEMQRSGDKRVTRTLITQFELSKSFDLLKEKGINL